MHDCVSVSVHLRECASVSMRLCECVSVSMHLCECASMSVHLRECVSVSVHWHPAHGAPLQSLQVGEGVAWREVETCTRREVRNLCF